jgi:hypothetical protein
MKWARISCVGGSLIFPVAKSRGVVFVKSICPCELTLCPLFIRTKNETKGVTAAHNNAQEQYANKPNYDSHKHMEQFLQ